MKKPTVGEAESEVLRWVASHAPASVSEVAESFSETRGLARTTLLTMMERLRHKGYLQREKIDGAFRYAPSQPHEAQLRSLVGRFVERSLGGSLDPFVAYLTDEAQLSDAQIEQLRQLVKSLDGDARDAKTSRKKKKKREAR